jgi:hypothetical protein
MLHPKRTASLRPRTPRLLAAAGVSLCLTASTAPQCTRTGDEVLSPAFSTAGQGESVGQCWRDCAQTANDARKAEQDRFVDALLDCVPGTDCRAREAALHVSIMQGFAETERNCMSGCHNQGRGHGGN